MVSDSGFLVRVSGQGGGWGGRSFLISNFKIKAICEA